MDPSSGMAAWLLLGAWSGVRSECLWFLTINQFCLELGSEPKRKVFPKYKLWPVQCSSSSFTSGFALLPCAGTRLPIPYPSTRTPARGPEPTQNPFLKKKEGNQQSSLQAKAINRLGWTRSEEMSRGRAKPAALGLAPGTGTPVLPSLSGPFPWGLRPAAPRHQQGSGFSHTQGGEAEGCLLSSAGKVGWNYL